MKDQLRIALKSNLLSVKITKQGFCRMQCLTCQCTVTNRAKPENVYATITPESNTYVSLLLATGKITTCNSNSTLIGQEREENGSYASINPLCHYFGTILFAVISKPRIFSNRQLSWNYKKWNLFLRILSMYNCRKLTHKLNIGLYSVCE